MTNKLSENLKEVFRDIKEVLMKPIGYVPLTIILAISTYAISNFEKYTLNDETKKYVVTSAPFENPIVDVYGMDGYEMRCMFPYFHITPKKVSVEEIHEVCYKEVKENELFYLRYL